MKMYIALAGFILVSLFAFVACSTKGDDYKEEQMQGMRDGKVLCGRLQILQLLCSWQNVRSTLLCKISR